MAYAQAPTDRKKIRILLVDDSALFLRTATRFLQAQYGDEMVVVGTADGCKAALRLARELQPELILLDINMPEVNGFEAIPKLRSILPDVRIIMLTFMNGDWHLRESITAGANGYVTKSKLDSDLWPTIQRVMRDGRITQN